MSLINDMLRDLEARHSDELKRQSLQGEIRPLPRSVAKPRVLRVVVIGLGVTLLSAGGLAWWFSVPTLGDKPKQVDITPLPALKTTTTQIAQATTVTMQATATTTLLPVTTTQILSTPSFEATKALSVVPVLVGPPTKKPANEAKTIIEKPVVSAKPIEQLAEKQPNTVLELEKKPVLVPTGKETTKAAGSIEVKTALATPRERADADFRAAQTLQASGLSAEALESLRSALRHEAGYAPARQLQIRLLLELKRLEEAMTALKEGLEHQPDQSHWAMTLARLQVDKNDLASAERTLARFAPQATSNAEYAGFHAHVHYRLGHLREAQALYQHATRLAANEGRWWFGLAITLEAEGKAGDARDAFRQALATGTLNNELSTQAMQRIR